jgi:hypothetical protein
VRGVGFRSLTEVLDTIDAAKAMLANPDIGVTPIPHRFGVSPATVYRYLPAARIPKYVCVMHFTHAALKVGYAPSTKNRKIAMIYDRR